jgi:hypothetical protein
MKEMTESYKIVVGKLGDLGNLGVDGRIILKRIFRYWIYLAEIRVHWRASVNTVLSLRLP